MHILHITTIPQFDSPLHVDLLRLTMLTSHFNPKVTIISNSPKICNVMLAMVHTFTFYVTKGLKTWAYIFTTFLVENHVCMTPKWFYKLPSIAQTYHIHPYTLTILKGYNVHAIKKKLTSSHVVGMY